LRARIPLRIAYRVREGIEAIENGCGRGERRKQHWILVSAVCAKKSLAQDGGRLLMSALMSAAEQVD
jgi:hypothetical protein